MEPTGVDLLPVLNTLIMAAVPVLLTWALARFNQVSGLQIEARHREALQQALEKGAQLALARLGATGNLSIDTGSPAINEVVKYVAAHTPDAIAHFTAANPGLNLEQMAEARLAEISHKTGNQTDV